MAQTHQPLNIFILSAWRRKVEGLALNINGQMETKNSGVYFALDPESPPCTAESFCLGGCAWAWRQSAHPHTCCPAGSASPVSRDPKNHGAPSRVFPSHLLSVMAVTVSTGSDGSRLESE